VCAGPRLGQRSPAPAPSRVLLRRRGPCAGGGQEEGEVSRGGAPSRGAHPTKIWDISQNLGYLPNKKSQILPNIPNFAQVCDAAGGSPTPVGSARGGEGGDRRGTAPRPPKTAENAKNAQNPQNGQFPPSTPFPPFPPLGTLKTPSPLFPLVSPSFSANFPTIPRISNFFPKFLQVPPIGLHGGTLFRPFSSLFTRFPSSDLLQIISTNRLKSPSILRHPNRPPRKMSTLFGHVRTFSNFSPFRPLPRLPAPSPAPPYIFFTNQTTPDRFPIISRPFPQFGEFSALLSQFGNIVE
jgi:hypothetical protein